MALTRQQLISSGLLVVMLIAYWFLLARKELSEIRSVQGEVNALWSTLSTAEAAVASFEEAQAQVDEVNSLMERVQVLYDLEGASPDFLRDVATTLEICGLTPSETSPGPIQELQPLTQQSIRIVVEGRLSDVFEFLRQMEERRPLCRVTQMRVEHTTSPGGIRADLTMLRLWKGV